MLTVIRGNAGRPAAGGGDTFTGTVLRSPVLPETDGISVGSVVFSPCARTHWHSHPGGQLLIVVAGEGFVADADGPVRVTTGDTVWTPPGVRHWHGACDTQPLVHTAVTVGGVEWAEPVSEEQFSAALGG
ncbi:cupin domain-containing protein [Saccharomonospora sp. NPDC046836]|uniref:cupin domain-containing protein n=1 Tax=Saccharomonospora sp. NPDC046836 TaxID=3156921 RepID=UPI0033C0AF83